MKKSIKEQESYEETQEQMSESEISEIDIKRQIKGEKKPVIDNNQMEMVLQAMVTTNFDEIFVDLKNKLKNEAKNSELIQLADEITAETLKLDKKTRFDQFLTPELEKTLTSNDEGEKSQLLCLNNKMEEQEKALKEYLKQYKKN